MLDHAADVIERHFREPGVAIAREEVLTVLPDGLVDMHARTIVAFDRLRHEGGGLAVSSRYVPHRVFENLRPVGALHEGAEARADFALAGAAHFVVMNFNGHTLLLKERAHFAAHVGQAVAGRNREVAPLGAVAVTKIAAFKVKTGRPGRFFRTNLEEGGAGLMIPLDGIKNEEFGFRAKISRVADAGRLQIGICTVGERTRITFIALAGRRFKHIAVEHERIGLTERIHAGSARIRLQQHVGRFNAAPADEGRTVEGLTKFKRVFIDLIGRNRQMHFLAEQIGDAQVYVLAVVVLDHLQYISSGRHIHLSYFDGGSVLEPFQTNGFRRGSLAG